MGAGALHRHPVLFISEHFLKMTKNNNQSIQHIICCYKPPVYMVLSEKTGVVASLSDWMYTWSESRFTQQGTCLIKYFLTGPFLQFYQPIKNLILRKKNMIFLAISLKETGVCTVLLFYYVHDFSV